MTLRQVVATTALGTAALSALACVQARVEPAQVSCPDYDPERFDKRETVILMQGGVDPATANRYAPQFTPQGIVYLHREGVAPQYANDYPLRFGGADVATLAKGDVSAEQAREYDERFDGLTTIALVKSAIPPHEAEIYDPRFGNLNVRYMAQEGMRPGEGNRYIASRFSDYKPSSSIPDIWFLVAAGVSPSVADRFPPEMDEQAIVFSLDHDQAHTHLEHHQAN